MVYLLSPLMAMVLSMCALWLFFLGVNSWRMVVLAVEYGVTSNQLRVSIRNSHMLQDAPSCQHSIGQIELLNLVRAFSGYYYLFASFVPNSH